MATVNIVAVYLVLNLFSESYAFVPPYTQRVCRVKDTCVTITQCQPYMVLFDSLKRPLNTNSLVFLRHQECGFEANGLPMVCCLTPSEVPQNHHQTSLNPTSAVQTTPKTTTTVRKNTYNWNFALTRDNRETNNVKTEREDELRRKMEAINQSFIYMDDFFAKRITDNANKTDSNDPK